MTKKEWIKKVMDGEPADRVPVGFWHHFIPHNQMAAIPGSPDLREQYLEANRQWKQDLDPDFIKIMTDGYLMLPVSIGDGSAQQIADLTVIDPEEYVSGTVQIVKNLRGIYGPDIMLFCNVFSPVIALVKAMRPIYGDNTYPALTKMLNEEPALIRQGLQRMTDVLDDLVKKVVAPDMADGIYLCSRMCRQPAELFSEWIAPDEIRLLNTAEKINPYNILHICDFDGKQSDIKVYRAYPGKTINWAAGTEGLSLREGKKLFGNRTVLGGLGMKKTDVLYAGTEDEIVSTVRSLVKEAGRDHLIIGADCAVDPGIDVWRLRLARTAANSN